MSKNDSTLMWIAALGLGALMLGKSVAPSLDCFRRQPLRYLLGDTDCSGTNNPPSNDIPIDGCFGMKIMPHSVAVASDVFYPGTHDKWHECNGQEENPINRPDNPVEDILHWPGQLLDGLFGNTFWVKPGQSVQDPDGNIWHGVGVFPTAGTIGSGGLSGTFDILQDQLSSIWNGLFQNNTGHITQGEESAAMNFSLWTSGASGSSTNRPNMIDGSLFDTLFGTVGTPIDWNQTRVYDPNLDDRTGVISDPLLSSSERLDPNTGTIYTIDQYTGGDINVIPGFNAPMPEVEVINLPVQDNQVTIYNAPRQVVVEDFWATHKMIRDANGNMITVER